MEYIEGKDLFDVIKDIGILNSFEAQFFTANIILVLEYLHSQKIIMREVKPDSFIVENDVMIWRCLMVRGT